MLGDFEPRSAPPARGRRVGALGPWVTGVVLLLTLGATAALRPGVADVGPYFARVSERIRAMPYTLGSWVGRDEQVVAAAREMLRPNEILQRRYTRLEDGQWFDVIVVHCGDVRDMQGHYPPVCYYSAGWEVAPGVPTTAGVGAAGIPATEYRVTYRHNRSVSAMRIVNFFAMPGDGARYAPDMRALEEIARSGARAQLGVMQVQVLTPVSMDEQTRDELMPAVWGVLEPVIREVVGGPDADV